MVIPISKTTWMRMRIIESFVTTVYNSKIVSNSLSNEERIFKIRFCDESINQPTLKTLKIIQNIHFEKNSLTRKMQILKK